LINIVLLGETGVGKTTIINAFANHITYNTYKDVIESKECTLLADTKFLYQPKDGEVVQITIGNPKVDRDVIFSETEACTSYLFTFVDGETEYQIRLIDTPGFLHVEENKAAGTRDDEFMKLVIDQLSVHENIDAYLLLLSPDNARFTESIKYCIERMLIELDSKAHENLLFGYTKCHNNFQSAPETHSILKKIGYHPNSRNEFFFENNPIRNLAALHNGQTISDAMYDLIMQWQKSSVQYARLVSTVIDLPSHDFKGAVTIQKVRQKIRGIHPFLLECTVAVEFTLKEIEDAKRNGKSAFLERKPLWEPLNSRKVVCTHRDCCWDVEETNINENDEEVKIFKKVYNQMCCDNCSPLSLWQNSKNLTFLVFCKKMKFHLRENNRCTVCLHPTSEHMQITYELSYQESKLEFSVEKEKRLRRARQQMLVCFARVHHFLKKNSFVMNANPLVEKIEQDIKYENEKEKRDVERRKNLENIKVALELAITSRDSAAVLTPEEINEELKGLEYLPEYGNQMKELFVDIDKNAQIKNVEKNFIVSRLPKLSMVRGLKKLTIRESEG